MKKIIFLIFLFYFSFSKAQIENLVIVTTDGFRWQEVFKGMDSLIAVDPTFNQKANPEIFKKYWAPSPYERRIKLMPFIWNIIGANGEVYGNRTYGNLVDNSNPYWFSYPGYSEIFCGYVDTLINTNKYAPNPNTNVLEFINHQAGYQGRVAAFCAWGAFDRILNKERSGFPIVAGAESCGGSNPDEQQRLINSMKHDSYDPFGEEEYLDVFTHFAAKDYLEKEKSRVLYISYGETDEWAHAEHYLDYLNAAHQVDQWLSDLWHFIQSDEHYKNKTALFITVDHGRGDIKKEQWTSHNSKIEDSHEIWFAVMGPGIPSRGELKTHVQLYQKQFAQTFAELLSLQFICEHPVAKGLKEVLMK